MIHDPSQRSVINIILFVSWPTLAPTYINKYDTSSSLITSLDVVRNSVDAAPLFNVYAHETPSE